MACKQIMTCQQMKYCIDTEMMFPKILKDMRNITVSETVGCKTLCLWIKVNIINN